MNINCDKNDIYPKKIKKHPKKLRYTKVHKQRASYYLDIFICTSFEDTCTISIGK
jgi:hypothetical protein